jgi:hypothetical protein
MKRAKISGASSAVIMTLLCIAACSSPVTTGSHSSRAPINRHDVVQAFQSFSTLASQRGQALARCMSKHGFTQLQAALNVTPSDHVNAGQRPYFIAIEDFGPTDMAGANQFGMAGNQYRSPPASFSVVARNPAFQAAAADCERRFDESHPGFAAIQQRAAGLAANVSQLTATTVARYMTEPIRRRLVCVTRQGLAFNVRSALSGDDMRAVLARAGIDVGRKPERRRGYLLLRQGGVSVYGPERLTPYRPTRLEVQIARTYVDCGERQEFAARLAEANHAAMTQVIDRYGDKLVLLLAELPSARMVQ